MDKLNLIRPSVFDDQVNAFFTMKNEGYNIEGKISGLNLGYNTTESKNVINQNRNTLYQNTGIENIVWAKQVHGSNIEFAEEAGTVKNCDGLITKTVGLALAIGVADCAAVLIYEPASRIVAAAHAGWRGAASGIIPKVLQAMEDKGAVMASAKAYISPCICKDHFEVGEEVAEQFPDEFVDYESYSKPHIKLKEFIKYQLMENKINSENIEIDKGCTVENKVNFYSYRREKEKSGRMAAVIQMK